jgi:hypothetical protein
MRRNEAAAISARAPTLRPVFAPEGRANVARGKRCRRHRATPGKPILTHLSAPDGADEPAKPPPRNPSNRTAPRKQAEGPDHVGSQVGRAPRSLWESHHRTHAAPGVTLGRAMNPTDDTPTAPPTTPPVPKRRASLLHPVSFVLTLVLLGTLLKWLPPLHDPDESVLPYVLGRWLGFLIAASILALIGWLLARRSRAVANTVFCLLIAIQIVGTAVSGIRRERAEKSRNYLERTVTTMDNVLRKGAENSTPEERKRVNDAIAAGAQALSGPAAIVMGASADASRRVAPLRDEYENRLKLLTDAGGFGAAGLKTPEDADDRIKLIRSLLDASAALEQGTRLLPDYYAQGLRERGAETAKIPRMKAAIASGANLPDLLELRALDRELCEASIAMQGLLRDNWTSWHLSEDGTHPIFAAGHEGALEEFNLHAAALKRSSDRQMELIAKVNSRLLK